MLNIAKICVIKPTEKEIIFMNRELFIEGKDKIVRLVRENKAMTFWIALGLFMVLGGLYSVSQDEVVSNLPSTSVPMPTEKEELTTVEGKILEQELASDMVDCNLSILIPEKLTTKKLRYCSKRIDEAEAFINKYKVRDDLIEKQKEAKYTLLRFVGLEEQPKDRNQGQQ